MRSRQGKQEGRCRRTRDTPPAPLGQSGGCRAELCFCGLRRGGAGAAARSAICLPILRGASRSPVRPRGVSRSPRSPRPLRHAGLGPAGRRRPRPAAHRHNSARRQGGDNIRPIVAVAAAGVDKAGFGPRQDSSLRRPGRPRAAPSSAGQWRPAGAPRHGRGLDRVAPAAGPGGPGGVWSGTGAADAVRIRETGWTLMLLEINPLLLRSPRIFKKNGAIGVKTL